MNETTRREFLTAGSAIAVGAAAMAMVPHVAFGDDANKRVGFAIVGLGRFGAGQLLRSMPECKIAKPVALVSGHPDKANALAAKYGVNPKAIYNYENFDSIKDNPEIDVVYVVLPNSMHAEYTIRAANAGKHVMCEKPMAINVAECQQMIDACKKNKRLLSIGYRLRYEPYNMKAIEICQSNQYGELRAIQSVNAFNIGPNEWRTDKTLSGGGPLMDLGIYCINAFRYLTGEEPTHVSAQTFQPKDDPRFVNTDGQMTFTLKFPSGVLASGETSYMHHSVGKYEIEAEQAFIVSEPSFGYGGLKLHIRSADGEQNVDLPQINQFATEMDAFANCVLAGRRPLTSGEEGLADLKVMMKLYESAESGKTVAV